MKAFLVGFTLSPYSLYVTNDNTLHTYNSVDYQASAIQCKEFTFDLKEIIGETNMTIPWSQAGFLTEVALDALEGPVQCTTYEFDTASSTGALVFKGFVNSFKIAKAELELSCISFVEQARDNYPRACLTRHCNHRLYSDLCTLDPGLYANTGTLTSISYTRTQIQVSGASLTQTGGWYQYGFIAGLTFYRHIVADSYNGVVRTIDLLYPAPSAWTVGLSITVTAGCNKTMDTCSTKFNNFTHYLGFPYAPYESVRFTGLRGQEVNSNKKGK